MTLFSRVAFVFFFLSVSTGAAKSDRMTPNVPWRTRENGERFLTAFVNAISDELGQEGVSDLEFLFESFLSLIPETSGKLSVSRLQALNIVFASAIAEIVATEVRGSTEQKIDVVQNGLFWAFKETTGVINTALIKEILSLTKIFSEEQEDNEIEEYPQQEYPGFTSQVELIDVYETSGAATSAQQSTSTAQSSSTTTSTTQTYSAASSASLTSTSAASEASSFFEQHLISVLQNSELASKFNSIASSGVVSAYASQSAEAVAYSIGQGDLASIIASAVSQATAGVTTFNAFIQALASTLTHILSVHGVLNLGNAFTWANNFATSLISAVSSSSASSGISAASGWSSASSQISLQTSSAATNALASSGASGGLSSESPFLPSFGPGLNDFDFLTPSPGIPAASSPLLTDLAPYSALINKLLLSPYGLTSLEACQRINSVESSLMLAVAEKHFNVSHFSDGMSFLMSQISQNTNLSPSEIAIEALLEATSALLHILSSSQVSMVSTTSLDPTVVSDIKSVLKFLNVL